MCAASECLPSTPLSHARGQLRDVYGSAQQSVKVRILRGFLKDDEFGLGSGQALHLQQQVIEIAVTPTAA